MTKDRVIEFANALKNNYTIDFDELPEFCDAVIEALTYDELREVRLEEVIEYCKAHDMALVAGELARELIIEKKNINKVLAEVKAEIKRMEYHMIDCDVLVSQEDVLDIIEKYMAESEG